MADSAQTKSEAPTPRRREEARKQGQVAVSTELTSGLLMLTGITVLYVTSHAMGQKLLWLVAHHLRFPSDALSVEQTVRLAQVTSSTAFGIVGALLFGTMIGGAAANIAQFGFRISTEQLAPKWSRLSPANGLKRVFSRRAVVRSIWAVSKLALVAIAVPATLYGLGPAAILAGNTSLWLAVAESWDTVLLAAYVVAGVQLAIGLTDYFFQRWQHEQDLRMSRRDVLEEQKQEEGDPHFKPRRRKLQREAAMAQQMLREVPQASVVLTNPTHLAIAIRYERGEMQAPRIIAKGEGHLAKRIAGLARENGIPVLERKPLARALYKSAEVGQEVPVKLYQAIAEVLAYVYRLQ